MPRMVRSQLISCILSTLTYLDEVRLRNCSFLLCYSTEHLGPVYEQIAKLEEALHNIQFEQHWLEAETDRQALSMSFKNNCISTIFFTLPFDFNNERT